MSIRIFKPDPTIEYEWMLHCFNCGNSTLAHTQSGHLLTKEQLQCIFCNTAEELSIEGCYPTDKEHEEY